MVVQTDPFWWHVGDYAEGVRVLSLSSVEHVDYTLVIGTNSLGGTGRVDFDLSINGILVGSFTVLPGELVKNVSFDFPSIAGLAYTIRLEETNTVDTGAGSITLPLDLSTIVLSSSQPDILKNTIVWLAEPVGDKHEPNENPSSCTAISFDLPIANATIDPAGDWDYYCFAGSTNQIIAADVDAFEVGSALDPVLTLFDSDGTTVLAQNDDFNGLDPYLEHTLPGAGTFYLQVRSFAHPCCGGPAYTYSLLLTGIKQPPPGDTDGDGCTDEQENGPNPALGGLRGFLNFWDFYDVWAVIPGTDPFEYQRDRAITVADVFAVAGRFGAVRGSTPTKEEALAEALTPPVSNSGYHASYDRGGQVGDNIWNQGPADGTITVVDVFAIAAMFGHTCL